jgi:hypothetical protein
MWHHPACSLAADRTRGVCMPAAGIGQYDLEAAWRLDTLLALGRSLGIRSLISLHTFNYFRTSDYYACVRVSAQLAVDVLMWARFAVGTCVGHALQGARL